MGKILKIDMRTEKVSEILLADEDIESYIGGSGFGARLLYMMTEGKTEPLSPDNPLIFMTGPLTGTKAFSSNRFEVVTRSPLTGIYIESDCGGHWGGMLKRCGWDGIVITGKSTRPAYLWLSENEVEIRDAGKLWGMDTFQTQGDLKKETVSEAEIVCIGPAGENLVLLASIMTDGVHGRAAGRGGVGAVMGSKNLKAIIALKGDYKVVPYFKNRFQKIKDRANKYINQNHVSLLMRQFGTAANANPIIKNNMLPVNNFTYGNHPDAVKITGEAIKENHNTRHHTCKPCSILCGHKGVFNKRLTNVPEYETLALLGANLGVFDPNDISRFNDICNKKGLDTISSGGTLAWVMEATGKGLVKTDLKFGSSHEIVKALNSIADLEGFGRQMAKGSRALSSKFGGKEFAIQVKGLEMAGYDPRGAWGQGLGYAVANRGACHLSSFPVGFENLTGLLNPHTIRAKPEFIKFFENINAAVNSMDICQFTGYGFTLETWLIRMTPHLILKLIMQNLPTIAIALVDFSLYPKFFSAACGIDLSSKQFLKAGERIHILERLMNTNEGIRKVDDTLPKRLLLEPQKDDPRKRLVPLDPMLEKYYKLRGYDVDGLPKKSLLRKLEIIM
ncbi:MAG: aldehyde ferredoxin oxidoreductase family protein [Desulfobacula sp.]|nr:aldehyde ferredoxin oxidoreductase family protein [Desulfobacula sp.]